MMLTSGPMPPPRSSKKLGEAKAGDKVMPQNMDSETMLCSPVSSERRPIAEASGTLSDGKPPQSTHSVSEGMPGPCVSTTRDTQTRTLSPNAYPRQDFSQKQGKLGAVVPQHEVHVGQQSYHPPERIASKHHTNGGRSLNETSRQASTSKSVSFTSIDGLYIDVEGDIPFPPSKSYIYDKELRWAVKAVTDVFPCNDDPAGNAYATNFLMCGDIKGGHIKASVVVICASKNRRKDLARKLKNNKRCCELSAKFDIPIEVIYSDGLLRLRASLGDQAADAQAHFGHGLVSGSMKLEPQDRQSEKRRTIIGGIVSVSGDLYGLTVTHHLGGTVSATNEVRIVLPEGQTRNTTVFSQHFKGLERGSESGTQDPDEELIRRFQELESKEAQQADGKASAAKTEVPNSDWALVELEGRELIPNMYQAQAGQRNLIEQVSLAPDLPSRSAQQRVYILLGDEIVSGTTSFNRVFIHLNQSSFECIQIRVQSDAINAIKSGSWIVDEAGYLCAVVIASWDSLGMVYCLSAPDIFRNISKRHNGAQVHIASCHEIKNAILDKARSQEITEISQGDPQTTTIPKLISPDLNEDGNATAILEAQGFPPTKVPDLAKRSIVEQLQSFYDENFADTASAENSLVSSLPPQEYWILAQALVALYVRASAAWKGKRHSDCTPNPRYSPATEVLSNPSATALSIAAQSDSIESETLSDWSSSHDEGLFERDLSELHHGEDSQCNPMTGWVKHSSDFAKSSRLDESFSTPSNKSAATATSYRNGKVKQMNTPAVPFNVKALSEEEIVQKTTPVAAKKNARSQSLKCLQCAKEFATKRTLERHEIEAHRLTRLYTCPVCAGFVELAIPAQDSAGDLLQPIWNCCICSDSLSSKDITAHYYTHHYSILLSAGVSYACRPISRGHFKQFSDPGHQILSEMRGVSNHLFVQDPTSDLVRYCDCCYEELRGLRALYDHWSCHSPKEVDDSLRCVTASQRYSACIRAHLRSSAMRWAWSKVLTQNGESQRTFDTFYWSFDGTEPSRLLRTLEMVGTSAEIFTPQETAQVAFRLSHNRPVEEEKDEETNKKPSKRRKLIFEVNSSRAGSTFLVSQNLPMQQTLPFTGVPSSSVR